MSGYGSKLGGIAIQILAIAAAVAAWVIYRTFDPERAAWAMVLATGPILSFVLGRRLIQPKRPSITAKATPERLTLHPGQVVPWNAVILEGSGEVDDGPVGGSVFGAARSVGDKLRGGARNGDGVLVIAPSDIEGPEEPPASLYTRSVYPEFVNRRFGVILIGLFVLAASVAVERGPAASMLAIAAIVPIGLGLVRGVVFATARLKARSLGIDLNDAGAIDLLAKADAIAFAPGGILTRIDLTLLSLHAAPGVKPVELIAAAATCCQSSQCSLARAILHFGVAHAVRLRAITDWQVQVSGSSESSQIIVAAIDLGAQIALADRGWLESRGILAAAFDAVELPPATPGRRLVWVAEITPHPNLLGALLLGDKLKAGAAELVKNLKRVGVKAVLLEEGASEGQRALARQLGLAKSFTPAVASVGPERAGLILVERTGGEARCDLTAARVRFGAGPRERSAGYVAEIGREDPRLILDLIRLARAVRRREVTATMLAVAFSLPGLGFAVTDRVALEIAAFSTMLGLVVPVLSAQFLHLFQPTASEVDEH